MGVVDFLFKEDSPQKEYDRICALPECNQALARNDKDPYLWNKRCHILMELGWGKEAIKAGKTAVELEPDDPDLWETLHDAYSGCNDREKADECQKNVVSVKKNR